MCAYSLYSTVIWSSLVKYVISSNLKTSFALRLDLTLGSRIARRAHDIAMLIAGWAVQGLGDGGISVLMI